MTIRWGIIGCGDVTEVKSGPGFQNAEGSELVAVMRRNGAFAADYARRHNVPRWYDNAESLIHDPDVDAVYIATPPGSHLEYALRVGAAGKPAYVEKPMARAFVECKAMTEAFQQANLPLFVAYYRRALPRFVKGKEIVESGALGTITAVSYRFASPAHRDLNPQNLPWRLRAEEAGGGLFMDLGCHTLDIIAFMVGDLKAPQGVARNVASDYAVEDTVALQFRLPSGGVGTALWDFASDGRQDLIEIWGTEGQLRLSTFGNEPVILEQGQGVEEFYLPNPKHIQQPFIQTMTDALRGKGTCASTGETAMRTAKVMDAALESFYGSRDDDFWNHCERWRQN